MSERLTFIRQQKIKLGHDPIMDTKVAKSRKVVKHGFGCEFQEGVLIGMDGFGYEINENGEYEKFPHYEGVVIGDYVHIYSGTTVQRGGVKDTKIGYGTKIAGQCQIGHSCEIGRNCLIGARTIVCGSAVLGDNVRTGEFVRIAPHVKVGNNVKIRSYCNVTKDVPNDTHVTGDWR